MTTYNLRHTVFSLFAALAVASPAVVSASPGGGHTHSHEPATPENIGKNAEKARSKMIADKKIPATWSAVPAAAIEQIEVKGKKEWRVIYKNPQGNKGEDTLYMFFSLTGNFIAANFTGK